MKKFKVFLSLLIVLFVVVTAGCSEETNVKSTSQENAPKQTTQASAVEKPVTTKERKVILYYPNKMGDKLIAVNHTLKIDDKTDLYKETLNALLTTSPKDKGITVIPKGTEVISTKLNKNNILDINFNNAFTRNFTGGAANSVMIIGSIVDTMTQFKEIKAVRFYVNGKRLETLGDYDLTEPIKKINNIL